MKETEKVMKQVDKEERRRSKQQGSSASSMFSMPSKVPLAATPPVMPRYTCTATHLCTLRLSQSFWMA